MELLVKSRYSDNIDSRIAHSIWTHTSSLCINHYGVDTSLGYCVTINNVQVTQHCGHALIGPDWLSIITKRMSPT